MAAPNYNKNQYPLKSYSIRTRFASNFIRALHKLNRKYPCGNYYSTRHRYRRCRKIKIAAYASMASAVGTRRAWSRALLRKIRTRRGARSGMRLLLSFRTRRLRKVVEVRGCGGRFEESDDGDDDYNNATELRKLVPGGDAMDMCKLLDETAHYIKCLTSQVEIMRNFAHLFST